MAKAGKTGVSSKTPKNILLGAGTLHKNLKYVEGTGWNFAETIIGATNGGSKLTISPELYVIEADGALVKYKGGTVKMGETAILEGNFLELTKDLIKYAIIGEDGVSLDEKYDLIVSKARIEEGDYLENIAYVGVTAADEPIIAILPNVLCTDGFNLETKNKEASVVPMTFECNADADSDLDKLPYEIYYPKRTTA